MTNPDELHEAIQAIHANGGYGDVAEDEGGEDGEIITHRYYFVSTKSPDNNATCTSVSQG